jgi:predicted metal-dependent RNase
MSWFRTQTKIYSFELVINQEYELFYGHSHGRVLLNECVTMSFNPSRIVTVQGNEMKILVELQLPYILLKYKFQLFVTLF